MRSILNTYLKMCRTTMAAVVVFGLVGCDPEGQGEEQGQTEGMRAVCVGVENGFAGPCPGAKVDATRMSKLLEGFSREVVLLLDEKATRGEVLEKMKWAVGGELAVVFYSGHGGQNWTGDSSEADGKDEFMCCWDKGLLDDDIWNVLSKGRRVVLICDCCHSETMFRAPSLGSRMMRRAEKVGFSRNGKKGQVSMLCWSGCPDDTFSYGSDRGGEFTNTLLEKFKKGQTYRELWEKIVKDKSLQAFEIVQETVVGGDFRDREVFR